MPEAVIVDAIRTPTGRAMKGSLKTVRADELAATPIRALIERNPGVDFSETVDVLIGAASGMGEQGYKRRPQRRTAGGPRSSRARLPGQPLLHPELDGSPGSLYDVYIPMGMTAENVAERCHVTREQRDEWAVISQATAVEARDSRHFDAEIVPVTDRPL